MTGTPRPHAPALLALALALAGASAGCDEELGPERPRTTTVRGVVRAGSAPVGGGWIEFDPVEGTVGNLRIARIGPDGSFRADRVPVGRVSVGLDGIPVGSVPAPGGLFDPRNFRPNRTSIRRTIPGRPDVDLAVDLLEEAARSRLARRGAVGGGAGRGGSRARVGRRSPRPWAGGRTPGPSPGSE